MGCSALKKSYRDILRGTKPDGVAFIYLQASRSLIEERMGARRGHFMPASLVESQFAALEEPLEGEGSHVVTVDVNQSIEGIVGSVLGQLKGKNIGKIPEVVVAVTTPELKKAEGVFGGDHTLKCLPAPSGEEELAAFVREKGVRHVVVGVEKYVGPLYDVLEKGGVVARFGVGYDGLDLTKATAKGLICTNTPGALDGAVAEYAITLMLLCAKRVKLPLIAMDKGEWRPAMGQELAGKVLLVAGCGAIGKQVGRMAKGLGLRLIGCEPMAPLEPLTQEWGFDKVGRTWEEVAGEADFVSLHIPSIPQTRKYFNAERLGLLKPTAVVVNTARGAIMDEEALYDALKAGRLGAAGLDVMEMEPYTPAHPEKDLRRLDSVVMLPHMGSGTVESSARMAVAALRNIHLAEAGDWENMNVINRS